MKHAFYMLAFLFVVNVSFAQNVEVQGNLKIINGNQGAGKFLMSDAAGNSNWVTSDRLLIESQKLKKGGIQRLLDWGIDPMALYQNGIPTDSIYGKVYGKEPSGSNGLIGRVIFVLDTLDQYPWMFVGVSASGLAYNSWGCSGTAITGAQGENFLDAYQNTADHLSQCTQSNMIFTNAQLYGGWKVASKADALLIYQNAMVKGKWNPSYLQYPNIWTSTEASGADEATKAWIMNKTTGAFSLGLKSINLIAFAIKTFDN